MAGHHEPATPALAAVSADSTDPVLSTIVIGVFALVATLLTLYLVAKGPRRRDED